MFEPLENNGLDTAHIMEAGLTFNRPFTHNFVGRMGIGGHAMIFPGKKNTSTFGGTMLLGFDIFPIRPLVISGEAQLGFLNHALYLRAEGSLGVMVVGPVELNIGYRGQTFMNVKSGASVPYHGFTGGFRIWF